MTRTLRNSVSFAMLMALLITACATTRLTSAWKDPSYQGRPHKIMIIGVVKNQLIKRIFEDELVRKLKERGTDAVASYAVMPDDKQGDHGVITSMMKEQGADAVLISRLASKKTVRTNVPGSIYYLPSYYGSWRDYYGYGYQAVYTPGYMSEDEYALIETNLYDAENDKLIWSAASETEILGSSQSQVKSYIGVIVKAMAEQKLLK